MQLPACCLVICILSTWDISKVIISKTVKTDYLKTVVSHHTHDLAGAEPMSDLFTKDKALYDGLNTHLISKPSCRLLL